MGLRDKITGTSGLTGSRRQPPASEMDEDLIDEDLVEAIRALVHDDHVPATVVPEGRRVSPRSEPTSKPRPHLAEVRDPEPNAAEGSDDPRSIELERLRGQIADFRAERVEARTVKSENTQLQRELAKARKSAAAREQLESELAGVRAELAAAQNAADAGAERLAQLQSELDEARADASATQAISVLEDELEQARHAVLEAETRLAGAAALEAELTTAQLELVQLREVLSLRDEELSRLREERERARAALEERERLNQSLHENITTYRETVRDAEAMIARREDELDELRRVTAESHSAAERLRTTLAQVRGELDGIKGKTARHDAEADRLRRELELAQNDANDLRERLNEKTVAHRRDIEVLQPLMIEIEKERTSLVADLEVSIQREAELRAEVEKLGHRLTAHEDRYRAQSTELSRQLSQRTAALEAENATLRTALTDAVSAHHDDVERLQQQLGAQAYDHRRALEQALLAKDEERRQAVAEVEAQRAADHAAFLETMNTIGGDLKF